MRMKAGQKILNGSRKRGQRQRWDPINCDAPLRSIRPPMDGTSWLDHWWVNRVASGDSDSQLDRGLEQIVPEADRTCLALHPHCTTIFPISFHLVRLFSICSGISPGASGWNVKS